MTRVLVAGSGVAAVECVLALRALAGARVAIEMLAPAAEMVHRPMSVRTPFGGEPAPRIDLTQLAARARHPAPPRLARIGRARDAPRPHARTATRLPYDVLVVATGARSQEAIPGAVTFRGPMSAGAVEQVIARVAAAPELRVAFAAPAGARWLLPLYELALLSAATLRERGVASPSSRRRDRRARAARGARPGRQRGRARRARSGGRGPRDERRRRGGRDRRPATPGRQVAAGRRGRRIARAGRSADRGPAAGRRRLHPRRTSTASSRAAPTSMPPATSISFPVKHGGLAAQQADAVAEAIAARVGAIGMPEPFRPVLRGLLMTGGAPLYLRVELGPGGRREHRVLPATGTASTDALWWPPGKLAGPVPDAVPGDPRRLRRTAAGAAAGRHAAGAGPRPHPPRRRARRRLRGSRVRGPGARRRRGLDRGRCRPRPRRAATNGAACWRADPITTKEQTHEPDTPQRRASRLRRSSASPS